ncbi:hypothetical protein BH10PLA2_BH10PLA2_29610 [soil metagenome]
MERHQLRYFTAVADLGSFTDSRMDFSSEVSVQDGE